LGNTGFSPAVSQFGFINQKKKIKKSQRANSGWDF
jgi:hypothetical protein